MNQRDRQRQGRGDNVRTPLIFPIRRTSSSSNDVQILRVIHEPFKFLPVVSQDVTLRQNYKCIEVRRPTLNFVYFARSMTFGKSFCVSVSKVLSEASNDFSFIVGFTTCSATKILTENARHISEQCKPACCGGHSQQLKVFKANALRSLIKFERQANGDIYFAINSSMPIQVKFDSSSCDINLARHELLIPYIQLSGNVLELEIEDQCPPLNIQSAIAVGHQPLSTASAYGPRTTRESEISPESEARHAFVASLPDADVSFLKLHYPVTDIKLSVNRMAVLRINENGERSIFYVNKLLDFEAQITFQVSKVYSGKEYTSGFLFGVTTASLETIVRNERQFVTWSTDFRHRSHSGIINNSVKLNDIFTFTRTVAGQIEVTKNGCVQNQDKLVMEGLRHKSEVVPFVVLNGTVSGIMIKSSGSGGQNIEFSRTHALPPIDLKTTGNIRVTHQTMIRWNPQNDRVGVIVNAKSFDKILKFIIRDVRTSSSTESLTFGLVDSTNIGFKTPREIQTYLDVSFVNLIEMPAVGLKFSLYKTSYGKVTLKYEDSKCPFVTLFKVDPSKCYYPVFVLNGSVIAIELLPNPTNQIVKHIPTVASSSQPPATTNECKICMDSTIDSAFVPCGHRFACYPCAEEWRRNDNSSFGNNSYCPICRLTISTILKTFD